MAHVAPRQARLVGFALARALLVLGAAMVPAALVGVAASEWNDVAALAIGASACVVVGAVGVARLRTRARLSWTPAFITLAWSWLLGAVAAAVPLYLSGHYDSYADAAFEALSGLTTTGSTTVHDLDHLGLAMNVWRHTLHLLGGFTILVAVHALLARRSAEVATLSVPEHGDDRVLPNVRRTARFALAVLGSWAVVGTVALWVAGLASGLGPARAALHAVTLAVSAVTTGGFAATSASVAFHHAPSTELVVAILMLAGALSLGFHQQLWRGPRRGVQRDLDASSVAVSVLALAGLVFVGLTWSGAFDSVSALLRKGLFTVVSAHTTSGLAVANGRVLATDWGPLVPAALVTAMSVGGMAGSTAGGVKGLRVGLIAKGVVGEVRRVLLPEAAVVVTTYHQYRRRKVTDAHVRAAATVLLLFLAASLGGALALQLVTEDLPLTEALFAATAAVTNTGLSIGVVSPDATAPVQLILATLMWVGRIEFLAAFALIGSLLVRPGRRS